MKIILVLLFLIFNSFINAQEVNYDLLSKNKVIGSLTARKTKTNKGYEYKVKSKVNYLYIYSYSYQLESEFENGHLIRNTLKTYLNGKESSSGSIRKVDDHYEISNDGEKTIFNGEITYSEAMIYFEEPINKTKLFSEFLGKDKLIKKIKSGNYKLTNPKNGYVSNYIYKNQLLQIAVIDLGLLSFKIVKSE